MGLKITIKGRVHDVGYRLLLMNIADSLLIEKFEAKNVKINGKEAVIVLVDGEEEQLKEFVEKVKSEKPELAVVEGITVEDHSGRIMDIERFRAGFNTLQLSKIVQVGLQMLQKQDIANEKLDLMLQKQDLMLQKQDETIKEVKAVREELKETREEVKAVKEELRNTREELKQEIRSVGEEVKNVSAKLDKTNELLERRFEKLEQEIERIKKALIKAGIEV